MKTRKIFECSFGGQYIIIIYHEGKADPFHVYRKYWNNGWHKKILEKYEDFNSCLMFVNNYYRQTTNVYSKSI